MSMGPRYGWLVCCLVSGCYAEHDGLLECDGPEETTWPCDGEVSLPLLPSVVCHLEDGTWIVGHDGDQSVHCESRADDVFSVRLTTCLEPGATQRHTSACGMGSDAVGLAYDTPRRPPPFSVELTPGRCTALDRLARPAEPYGPRRDYAQLCDDPLARCGAPLVFDVVLSGVDACGGRHDVERCDLELDGDRLIVAIDSAPAVPLGGCETIAGARVATCVAPPLGAGTYTVLDTAGRVLGDLEVPLEQDAPREPRCTPIE